jgi:hypothetical protein
MDPMQPPVSDPPFDHPVREPDLEQLGDRHHPVLPNGESRDRQVQPSLPPADGRKSTYTVDFLPRAGHAPIVGGKGARVNA